MKQKHIKEDNSCRAFFMKAVQTRPEILRSCRTWIGFEEFFLSLWRLRGSKVRFLGYWDRPQKMGWTRCNFCCVFTVDFLHHELSCWFGLAVWVFLLTLHFCFVFGWFSLTHASRASQAYFAAWGTLAFTFGAVGCCAHPQAIEGASCLRLRFCVFCLEQGNADTESTWYFGCGPLQTVAKGGL